MKFRKKPIVIEAIRVADLKSGAPAETFPEWVREAVNVDGIKFVGRKLEIVTLEGVMEAREEDWLIRGVKGELYPCKPDIFAASYEPEEEAEEKDLEAFDKMIDAERKIAESFAVYRAGKITKDELLAAFSAHLDGMRAMDARLTVEP